MFGRSRRQRVLDNENQKTPKLEITFPVGKLFMVMFGDVREKKGPLDRILIKIPMRNQRDASAQRRT
jgi:hypothetical protein